MNSSTLTILTPTLNAIEHIEGFIGCLNKQTSQNFILLIVDGGSTDGTIDFVRDHSKFTCRIIKSKDFSIYHATNNGVAEIQTKYYAVSGADDRFSSEFVRTFQDIQNKSDFDLIFGAVKTVNGVIQPGENRGWLYGMHGVGSSHSIGTIIKTSLHNKYGLYSKLFPVVADQFFIKNCIYGGAKVLRSSIIFGFYSQTGFSSTNKLHYQFDFFKMQILTEKFLIVQLIIFLLRLIKLKLRR